MKKRLKGPLKIFFKTCIESRKKWARDDQRDLLTLQQRQNDFINGSKSIDYPVESQIFSAEYRCSNQKVKIQLNKQRVKHNLEKMQNQITKSNRTSVLLEYEELDHKAYQRWSIKDNIKYITFLKNQIEHFENEKTRRAFKVFKMLADYLGTKTQAQCKSHHQKMIKQYLTIDCIIQKVISRAEKKKIDISLIEAQIIEEANASSSEEKIFLKNYSDLITERTQNDDWEMDSISIDCSLEDDIFNVITPDVWINLSE